MTQDDILEMARSAGLTDGIELQHEIDAVMRFAELVAAAEREACAKTCEDFAYGTSAYEIHHRFAAYKCADLILKSGEDESIS